MFFAGVRLYSSQDGQRVDSLLSIWALDVIHFDALQTQSEYRLIDIFDAARFPRTSCGFSTAPAIVSITVVGS
jgi:hypothetical protein